MTLEEALAPIAPVVGLSSLIGAPSSVSSQQAVAPTLTSARARYEELRDAMNNAQSDFSYWGYAGQVSYWKAVVDILEAAELAGADNLPDVEPPRQGGVVMDQMSLIERYGETILREARLVHPGQETLA